MVGNLNPELFPSFNSFVYARTRNHRVGMVIPGPRLEKPMFCREFAFGCDRIAIAPAPELDLCAKP